MCTYTDAARTEREREKRIRGPDIPESTQSLYILKRKSKQSET